MQKKIVEKEVFIAMDGTEFLSEDECNDYEKEILLRERVKQATDASSKFFAKDCTYTPLSVFIGVNGDMRQVKHEPVAFYNLESKDDGEIVATSLARGKTYEDKYRAIEHAKRTLPSAYPCIGAVTNQNRWRYEVETMEGNIKLLKKFFSVNGYEMSVKKA